MRWYLSRISVLSFLIKSYTMSQLSFYGSTSDTKWGNFLPIYFYRYWRQDYVECCDLENMFSTDSMKCNDVFTLFIRHLVSKEDLLLGIFLGHIEYYWPEQSILLEKVANSKNNQDLFQNWSPNSWAQLAIYMHLYIGIFWLDGHISEANVYQWGFLMPIVRQKKDI